MKWDGKTWTAQSSGTGSYLHGGWGTDANNVWVAGWGGTIGLQYRNADRIAPGCT